MINIKNLSLSIDDKKVLNDINITFPKNKLSIILGPNGSGKTTLIKTVLGLLKYTEGNILIDSKELSIMDEKEKALNISYLSQSRNTPSLSVERMVLHGRFPHLSWPRHYSKKDWDIVEDAMRKTGCISFRKRNLTTLSGGERQKVYLAMCLCQTTPIILMDEPTTYLDIENQLSLMKLCRDLCENENKTIVMVLHDIPLSLKYADYLCLLNKGNIVAKGTRDEVYNSHILDKTFNVSIKRTLIDNSYHYYTQEKE